MHELAGIVATQVKPLAKACDVDFRAEVVSPGTVSSRAANLIGIILGHLVQNAIQATPRRKRVRLRLLGEAGCVRCEVRDQGPGFPPDLLPLLFKPCISTKDGGNGLGLALCQLLAGHLDAALDLEQNTAQGCIFGLTLPENLAWSDEPGTEVPQVDESSFKPS